MTKNYLDYEPVRRRTWKYYLGWALAIYAMVGSAIIALDLLDPVLRSYGGNRPIPLPSAPAGNSANPTTQKADNRESGMRIDSLRPEA